jgi:hypothetical protein
MPPICWRFPDPAKVRSWDTLTKAISGVSSWSEASVTVGIAEPWSWARAATPIRRQQALRIPGPADRLDSMNHAAPRHNRCDRSAVRARSGRSAARPARHADRRFAFVLRRRCAVTFAWWPDRRARARSARLIGLPGGAVSSGGRLTRGTGRVPAGGFWSGARSRG